MLKLDPETTNRNIVLWPLNKIPVELFTIIISYLPRSNIQSMRLVNKEFDLKVSQVLFRTVVVPFKPEIYGITPETTLSNDVFQGSIMLQDKGMRVFQGRVATEKLQELKLTHISDLANGFADSL